MAEQKKPKGDGDTDVLNITAEGCYLEPDEEQPSQTSDGGSSSLKRVGVFVDLGTARSRKKVITLDGEKAGPAAGTRLSRRNGGC